MWGVILKGFAVALSAGGITPAAEDCKDPNCCGALFCPPPKDGGGVVYRSPEDTLDDKHDRAPTASDEGISPLDQDFFRGPDDRRVTE